METLTLVYIVIGLVIVGVVALKPRLFWPMLIIVAVGTAGLYLPQYSLPLVDEYFVGCVLIGGLLAISVRLVSPEKSEVSDLDRLHMLVFSLMIVYMLVQSIRGLLLWGDLRLSRWIVYYIMLGMLSFILYKGYFPVPNVKKISSIILLSALLYFIAYLSHGYYTEEVRGLSYLQVQGIEWSGPAYAMFPLVVAIPAAMFLLKGGARNQKWISWALIILVMIAGYFYDSRTAWIGVMTFLVVSPVVLRLRQTAMYLLIFLGLAFFLYGYAINFLQMLVESALLHNPSEGGRLMMATAAFGVVSADWTALLFGCGVHSHHFLIGPYLEAIGYGLLPSYVRVSGFASMLVDTGVIGMLLLGMNFLFTALKILIAKRPGRVILLVALLLPIFWLLTIDIDDIVLFYLMIMPSGLLVQLSRYGEVEQGPEKKSAEY